MLFISFFLVRWTPSHWYKLLFLDISFYLPIFKQILIVLELDFCLLDQQFFVLSLRIDKLLLQFKKYTRIDHSLSPKCIDLILSLFIFRGDIIDFGQHLLQIIFQFFSLQLKGKYLSG